MKKTKFLLLSCLISVQLLAQRNDNALKIDVSTSNYSGSLQNGSWSPNNQQLMCTNWQGGYNQSPADILIINLSDSTLTPMTTDGQSNINMPGQTWCSVTGKILFSSEYSGNGDQAHIMTPSDGAGTAVKITPFTDRMCWEPGFSPNGDYIVYEAHYFSNSTIGIIETYKVDGSENAVQLTDGSFNAKQPTWSPTGDKIAYQKFNGSVWDIWIMNTDGSNKQNITGTDPGDKTDATFSPDGQWIVYSSNNGTLNYANIFIKNLTTGQLIQVTNYTNGYDGAPSWGTNNKIVFESTIGEPDTSSGATLWMIDAPVNGVVGMADINANLKSISVFPNPANQNVRLKFKDKIEYLEIFSIDGNLVATYSPLTYELNIDISTFDSGIYLILINKKHYKKFIKR